MAKFTSKVVRQLNLLIYLLKSTVSVSFSQIKEKMSDYANEKDETSRKLFERDKKDLRTMGIPLTYNKSEDTYTIESTRFYIQKMTLSEEEKYLLRVMINMLLNTKQFPIFQNELASSMQKLAASGYYSMKNGKSCPSYMLTSQVKKFENEIDSTLYDISAAIFDKQRLLFEYPSITDDKITPRHVDPLGMMFRDGTPYLIGYCHMRRYESSTSSG
jgi:proteasome accessory factor B